MPSDSAKIYYSYRFMLPNFPLISTPDAKKASEYTVLIRRLS